MSDGELRQGQVLSTFGPGSMVDLPEVSIIVGGLELWKYPNDRKERIYEARLEAKLAELLQRNEVPLYAPPIAEDDPASPFKAGITVVRFPRWFLAQVEQTYRAPDGREYRTRPLVRFEELVGGKFQAADRTKHAVVPVRFVRACPKGHIDDVDWRAFVRAQRGARLWLDEAGAGNDFAEIFVRDEATGVRRQLADAALPGLSALGFCSGRMPWLGVRVRENCTLPARLLTRSATNSWFSQTLSVISIPDPQQKLRKAVDKVYDTYLNISEGVADVARERRRAQVRTALEGLTDQVVWEEIQRRKEGRPITGKSIKQAEIETLLMQPTGGGEDSAQDDFFARTRVLGSLPAVLNGKLDKVVLVHRLREVVAALGFTRFEAVQPDINGDLSLGVERAPLAAEAKWLPAIENRGEGVFLSFAPAAIQAWLARAQARGRQLDAGFHAWLRSKTLDQQTPWLGLPYVMLHSLSHLLITAVSLECGYAASSIRERIYAGSSGYGILLYTGGSGVEGTLGGLVEVGRHIEYHLQRALELGRLCSNDPVCAQHGPDDSHEERFLHGAACHGCLLISETCCERRNEHLDRALVVPTLTVPGVAFFSEAS
jgi:Domain of unknown function (DUF1998)